MNRLFIFFSIFFLTGCGGDDDSSSEAPPPPAPEEVLTFASPQGALACAATVDSATTEVVLTVGNCTGCVPWPHGDVTVRDVTLTGSLPNALGNGGVQRTGGGNLAWLFGSGTTTSAQSSGSLPFFFPTPTDPTIKIVAACIRSDPLVPADGTWSLTLSYTRRLGP